MSEEQKEKKCAVNNTDRNVHVETKEHRHITLQERGGTGHVGKSGKRTNNNAIIKKKDLSLEYQVYYKYEEKEGVCGGKGQVGVADVESVTLGWLEGAGSLQGVRGADADAVPEGREEKIQFFIHWKWKRGKGSVLYTMEVEEWKGFDSHQWLYQCIKIS